MRLGSTSFVAASFLLLLDMSLGNYYILRLLYYILRKYDEEITRRLRVVRIATLSVFYNEAAGCMRDGLKDACGDDSGKQ